MNYKCTNCALRAKYDANPQSLVGRFWHFHIKFCPGWKNFYSHQDAATQQTLTEKYGYRK